MFQHLFVSSIFGMILGVLLTVSDQLDEKPVIDPAGPDETIILSEPVAASPRFPRPGVTDPVLESRFQTQPKSEIQ